MMIKNQQLSTALSFPDIEKDRSIDFAAVVEILEQLIDRRWNNQELQEVYDKLCPKKLYKYRVADERTLLSIINQEVYFADPPTLNDPLDGRVFDLLCNPERKLPEDLRRCFPVLGAPKIACFSKNYHNNLLWAHYANGHRGICIEYDYKSLFAPGNKLALLSFPVFYTNYFDIIKNTLSPQGERIDLNRIYIYLTHFIKSKTWEYENELRILSFDNDGSGRHEKLRSNSFYKIPISAVYIGAECKKDSEFLVNLENICKNQNIKLFQMKYTLPCDGNDISLNSLEYKGNIVHIE